MLGTRRIVLRVLVLLVSNKVLGFIGRPTRSGQTLNANHQRTQFDRRPARANSGRRPLLFAVLPYQFPVKRCPLSLQYLLNTDLVFKARWCLLPTDNVLSLPVRTI